jgi:hypothetical protein
MKGIGTAPSLREVFRLGAARFSLLSRSCKTPVRQSPATGGRTSRLVITDWRCALLDAHRLRCTGSCAAGIDQLTLVSAATLEARSVTAPAVTAICLSFMPCSSAVPSAAYIELHGQSRTRHSNANGCPRLRAPRRLGRGRNYPGSLRHVKKFESVKFHAIPTSAPASPASNQFRRSSKSIVATPTLARAPTVPMA